MNSSLRRNIIRTFSTQVGGQLIAVLSGIVVARSLGPAGKGFFSYAATALSFISVFFYGFSDAILYQFGKQRYPAKTIHTAAVRILASVLAVAISLFVVLALITPSQQPLLAAALALPFAMYVQLMTPFLMVKERIGLLNLISITQILGTAALTVPLLLFTHLGLPAVIAVWTLFYILSAARITYAMNPILCASASDTCGQDPLKEQLHFGLRTAGSSVAGYLNMRVDIFVVSVMFAPSALGSYTLAIGTGEMLWQVSRAFVWSALGRIGSGSFTESAELVARLTRNTLAIVASFGFIAFLLGPWLITHIYGEDFVAAGTALRWVLPGLIAYASEVALTKFIILQLMRPATMILVQTGSAILCALATIIEAGRFGITAAAASTSVTYLTVTIVLVVIFMRGTGISAQRLLIVQREDLRHYISVIDGMLKTLRLRSA